MSTVSVIIPTRNRPQFLKEAIESVLTQTYQDWELIVVDDGSAEPTRQVVMGLIQLDGRIHYEWQPHQGVSAAVRNHGLSLAGGELVAFLDDDDLWLPHKLEVQVRQLMADPGLGFVYCPMLVQWPDGRIDGRKPSHPPSADSFEELLQHNFIPSTTPLVRRQCLRVVSDFDREQRVAEDYDLWLRLARRFPFGSTQEPLAIYRIHGTNKTSTIGSPRYQGHTMILERFLSDPDLRGIHRDRATRRLARELHLLAKAYLVERRYPEAFRTFARELRIHPLAGLEFAASDERCDQRVMKAMKPYVALVYAWVASMKR